MQDDCFHAVTSLISRRISGSRFCQRWTAWAIIRCHFQRRSRGASSCGMNSSRQSAGIVFQKCWRATKNPTTANRLRRKRRWPFGELATAATSASAPLRRDNLTTSFRARVVLVGIGFETRSASGGRGAVLVANLTRPVIEGVSVRVIGIRLGLQSVRQMTNTGTRTENFSLRLRQEWAKKI